MCRFLFVNKTSEFGIEETLLSFSQMCRLSRTPFDNDRQKDGWGITWLDQDNKWVEFKSTDPIWENINYFTQFPNSKTFIAHARSKSFNDDVVDTKFNQPLVDDGLCFALNGEMKGVSIRIDGDFGAAKVFNLIKKYIKTSKSVIVAVEKTRDQINIATKKLKASNFILCDKKKVYVLCNHWGETPKYHTLHISKQASSVFICSEPLDITDNWYAIKNQVVIEVNLL
jgi:predicted glutamine amidotransferase